MGRWAQAGRRGGTHGHRATRAPKYNEDWTVIVQAAGQTLDINIIRPAPQGAALMVRYRDPLGVYEADCWTDPPLLYPSGAVSIPYAGPPGVPMNSESMVFQACWATPGNVGEFLSEFGPEIEVQEELE